MSWQNSTTVDQWIEKLKHKELSWLLMQKSIGYYNGVSYSIAVRKCIEMNDNRHDDEYFNHSSKKRKVTLPSQPCDAEDDYVIRHVPCGPKGMTERVRVHKSVDTE